MPGMERAMIESKLMNLYWTLTYYPRCAILLAKHRNLPSNMSFSATLRGIVRMEIRPHWLRS